MSSQTPPQGRGGVKGFFKHLSTKFKKERRTKDRGSRAHDNLLAVPTSGDGYESSTYSAGQSRSTTPVPKESKVPAAPETSNSVLGPVHQTTPHRPSTSGTGNDHNLERAPESSENTFDNVKSASDTSVPTSTPDSKRTARLWFDAATGFGKTLLKKLPDVVDTNPVKVIAAIVKVAIEAAETVGDNKDNLTRLSTKLESLAQLGATEDGISTGAEAMHKSLKEALSNVSATISNLTSQSIVLQTISYEQYSKEIQGLFDVIDDAVQAFQVQIARNIEAKAEKILDMARDEKLYRLNPSPGAQYDSDVEGQRIRREECTKGTRVGILDNIAAWARDDSPQSPLVYWLTGQAGSGKTSIATSIAAKFSGTDENIILGANFFCSRNTPETNTTRRIVPTVAYQLARKCPPYAEALIVPSKLDKLDNVYRPVPKQLQALFFVPWVQCEARRNQSRYLIVIDALDELKENGAVEFIDALFALFMASPVNGVKVFITSRSEHHIINRVEPFYSRTIRWLQEVPLEDVSGDIRTYLRERLPTLGDDNLDKLRDIADGLFIYAATAVRYLKPTEYTPVHEQVYRLQKFLKYSRHAGPDRPDFIVDELYRTIMVDALHPHINDLTLYMARLKAIHLILSTGERASTGTIAALFNVMDNGDFSLTEDVVMSVVQTDLYSVLYVKDGLIFWYHASFPDFIFNPLRSNFKFILNHTEARDFEFTCDEESQQTRLRNLCFSKLKELSFNMSSIPSSFDLNEDHSYNPDTLLVYSAVNWSHHLPITGESDSSAGDIGELLDIRALFWIELMNITQRVSDCVSILERAQRWVRQHINVDAGALDERLSEVIAFAKKIPERIDTFDESTNLPTPHLYISYLAAWSKGPKTIQPWKENFWHLPLITHSHKDISLIFTANGQMLLKDKRVAQQVKFRMREITSVAFMHKDTQILSGYEDGSFSIWDTSTGTLQVHLEVNEQLELSAHDDTTAITGFDNCVCIWHKVGRVSIMGGTVSLYPDFSGNTGFWSIAASADSTKIRSESIKGKVYLWGLVSGSWQLLSRFDTSPRFPVYRDLCPPMALILSV